MDGLRMAPGMHAPVFDVRSRHHALSHVRAAGSHTAAGGSVAVEAPVPARRSSLFVRPLRWLWPGGHADGGVAEKKDEDIAAAASNVLEEAAVATEEEVGRQRRDNWVLKIMRVTWLCAEEEEERAVEKKAVEGDVCVTCGACAVGEGRGEVGGGMVFDRESFSRLLRRVTLAEAQVYAKMSYLGSLAYTIPKIKPVSLLKYHGLCFVTSSLERRAKFKAEKEQQKLAQDLEQEAGSNKQEEDGEQGRKDSGIGTSTANQITAPAASYLQSQTRDILPFESSKPKKEKDSSETNSNNVERGSSEVADFVATSNSVTAVVAGKEEMKQAVAKDLNSAQASPCEWFICDDASKGTRYFVIQGSETLASWQANLLFEPIQFEGLDVLVHRGIYEAAKGIYKQMLPEVQAHLKSWGDSATLRFTGHSLGGSLALLMNLMLLIRGEAPPSSLLPVITFGAPSIMCGGDYLLHKLGLPERHVQAIMMHRDIVPRAFSCNYPDHVAKILKAINGNFRNHPCLQKQKFLYAPMGKLLILQPEEKYSPNHHLLPPGSGLYLFGNSSPESSNSVRLLQAARSAFLNSPHPLEILSDHNAYGSEGTVYRDHDTNAYLRSMYGVIRQVLKQNRKAKKKQRHQAWWPLVAAPGIHAGTITGQQNRLSNSTSHHYFSFSGVIHGGKVTLKSFGRMVASQHVHMLVVLLFPARLLLLGAMALVDFR